MKKQLIPLLLLLFYTLPDKAQLYSRYYFHDTLKDDGLTSEIHSKYSGKVYFKGPQTGTSGYVKDGNGNTLQFRKEDGIDAYLYLERSLRYYYVKYQNDKQLNFNDWNYGTWKGNYTDPGNKSKTKYIGCLIIIMTINNDTAAAWKTSLWEKDFNEKTTFNFDLWDSNNSNKNMGDEDELWPLFTYVKKNKKAGDYEVKIDVYPGKLNCKSINDRGPDKIATGTTKFIVSQADMDYLDGLSNKSLKPKFKDYDFDQKILWGVKQ